MDAIVAAPLSKTVLDAIGENVFRCYQCVKCSSGCPLAERFDLTPNQVMRSLQFGLSDVLESRAIWLCASCHTCATRCPQEIDVTGVMDTLRQEARRRGIAPAIPEIAHFNEIFLANIKFFGRVYELGLMGLFNLRLGQPLKHLRMGWEMLRRGRFNFLPKFVRPAKTAQIPKPAVAGSSSVAYFPGCALDGSSAEYDRTARAVARHLEIDLVEPPGWTCCGSSPAHASDRTLATVLPMRTIATVEKMGIETITSPCSSCFARLKTAEHEVTSDHEAAAAAESATGYAYQGGVSVEHLLDTLIDKAGLDDIRSKAAKPLTGLKVACYYGCLITRPARLTGAAHYEYPVRMDELMRALGAEPVDWSFKTDCCGNSLSLTQTEVAVELSQRVVRNAQDCGADAIVTMCPMCHLNLDARQPEMDLPAPIPILHATQLMLLAFGDDPRVAELAKNITDPRPLLRRKMADHARG
ncbi:MAG TPA: heterodisulfide reductase-related iron-sulfur binding cluster [Alphaproteobacteria bacterium]|nr:heterodisulfide reductase-related iron-sulfur binding cluster [Alphaproteobacteria bacterium]